MKIAIVGTGIAGHAAALALRRDCRGHDLTIYESAARAGGHAATVDIDYHGKAIAVDTGFIVFNMLNYPNLTAFFDWAGIATQASEMSFAVSADNGAFEFCGRESGGVMSGLFAQKSNLLSPSYLLMLREILRFQTTARRDRSQGSIGPGSLADYLRRGRFSARLQRDYLVPMGAAIWSTSPKAMLDFPAQSFIDFFDNHCLLQWNRPKWRTVTGGSRAYVAKIQEMLAGCVRLATPVTHVRRRNGCVQVIDAHGHTETYDHVVLATHARQALALLEKPSALERDILGAMRTSANDVVLHCDSRLMPRRRAAWGAWNFLRSGRDESTKVCVTYWMNMLQGIDPDCPLFITLNPPVEPRPESIFGRYSYAHPQFDAPALAARTRLDEIQGASRIWYCGAWTGHGFHEDGMASGLDVARRLGAAAPWTRMLQTGLREAAE